MTQAKPGVPVTAAAAGSLASNHLAACQPGRPQPVYGAFNKCRSSARSKALAVLNKHRRHKK
jgi:hypothetical protein